MDDFFNRYKRFAVLGLSGNPRSFSRQACDFLRSHGCEILAVNPNQKEIDGDVCYQTVKDIPGEVQAAVFFTNPSVSLELLPQCAEIGVQRVWFQQGAASPIVHEKAEELGIAYKDSCVYLHHPDSGFPHNFHRFVVRIFGIDQ